MSNPVASGVKGVTGARAFACAAANRRPRCTPAAQRTTPTMPSNDITTLIAKNFLIGTAPLAHHHSF
jgi:hypothetical protein